jgi:predicted PurR-regulated permease PerM
LDDDQSAVAGWAPVGKVAGYRDAVTGRRDDAPQPPNMALVLRQILGIAIAAAAIATLYFGQDVLIPITLAFILSFILSPLVNILQRLRFPRVPAVLLTVMVALGFIGSVGMLIATQTAALSESAPKYARTLETKVQGLQGAAVTRFNTLSKSLGLNRAPGRQTAVPSLYPVPSGSARRPVLVEVAPPATTPWGVMMTLLQPIVGPLETMLIVIVVAIFILVQKEDLRDRFIRVFGSGDLHRTTLALDDAGTRLSRYFLSQLAVNTTFGLTVTIGLWLIGIPSPALWGVLAALLRFVPYIGSVLAAAAPIALAAAIEPGWGTAILVAGFFATVETLIGYVVEPLIYGHSTGLSPTSVVVSAIFWTWLWGPIGLVMSTPLTLCLVVLGRHVKALEYFDVVLGDRPALTPVERFYQRLLADNADEALAQAELMLGESTLAECYDAVAMPALRFATADAAKELVDTARIAQIRITVSTVIEELGIFAAAPGSGPVQPAPGGRVVCVGGSGVFDDLVAQMLCQVLERAGCSVERVDHATTRRTASADLDIADADTIVLCSLVPQDALAQSRVLMRRLRDKAPKAMLIFGFWRDGTDRTRGSEDRSDIAADAIAGCLADVAGLVGYAARRDSRTVSQDAAIEATG